MFNSKTYSLACDVFKAVAIVTVAASVGLGYGVYMAHKYYNTPVSGIQLKMLQHLCSKNEGIKEVKKEPFNPLSINLRCTDGAVYQDVTFNLIEKKEIQ